MSCGFDKGLLAAHYDGEATAGERAEVERHAAGCPECARDLASMKDLAAALKPLARGAAPMSIAEGVMKEIRPAAPAPRRWISFAVSAAAAVLLAVGAVMLTIRQTAPEPSDHLAVSDKARKAPAPAMKPSRVDEPQPKAEAKKEFDGRLGAGLKDRAEESPAPPAAPAEGNEPPAMDSQVQRESEERDATAELKTKLAGVPGKAPAVPVVRVSSADVAAARAAVEAFMAERKVKVTPGAPLLGRGEFVQTHYLQLDLTTEETAALQRRLAELKETALASGSFEDEKKRVAEELAKEEPRKKSDNFSRSADDKADAAKPATEPAEKSGRGRALNPDAPVRKKIIFVFEPLPKK
jgi:hypothetical protein